MPIRGKKQSLHCLPSDSNIRKEWINFIFIDAPDHISKNLVLCSLNFIVDTFTNKAQSDAEFSERLKLKDDAVPTILDPTVMSHHTSLTVFIMWSLLLYYRSFICTEYVCFFDLNQSSVHLWGMLSVKHTNLLAYMSTSLQSANPIQTESCD